MMPYEFIFPNKVIFARGSLKKLGQEVKELGKKCLLVTGKTALKKAGILDEVVKNLQAEQIKVILYDNISPEPWTKLVDEGVKLARNKKCDLVISLGGGSALDVGKVIAGITNDGGKIEEYFAGRKIIGLTIPFIAVPTTCGTGSEATYVSVIIERTKRKKTSLKEKKTMPKIAIIDPELSGLLSPELIAISGADALVHAIESYTTQVSNFFSDMLALKAIKIIIKNLKEAVQKKTELAIDNMCLGAFLAGLSLTNSGLGAAHGLGSSLGAYLNIPHGIVVALLLPEVIKYNLDILPEKYTEITNLFENKNDKNLSLLLKNLFKEIKLFPYKKFEISPMEIELIVKNASGALQTNPYSLSFEENFNLIKKVLQ